MLLELLIGFFFGMVDFLVGFFPDLSMLIIPPSFSDDISVFIDFLSYGFVIFPLELFIFFIGNVAFWLGIQIPWAIIEWLYKKLPGVN